MGRTVICALGWLAATSAAACAAEGAVPDDRLALPRLRNCAAQGPDFVAVPGSETCLRIGGRVRAEAGTRSRRAAAAPVDAASLRASGRLAVDARTQTDYGPARAFVRFGTGAR